ncbi:MAG: alpha/beta hydrolase [Promethearchaeota archaeon]|nr:MAG: alpha/beta hydrolase [Candidatus Lokiarchaeota archaeon]
MVVSKKMQRVIKVLLNNRKLDIKNRVKSLRNGLEKISTFVSLPPDVNLVKFDLNGMTSAWISTPESREDHVILYLHGGGYIGGSIQTHRELASRICRVAKARLLLIEYGLAPEHPFPAAIEDAINAYEWLMREVGIPSERIIIAGDSAGGGLTLATLLKIKDMKIDLPIAAVCLSPFIDLTFTGDSFRKNAKIDPFTSAYNLDFYAALYIGDNDPENPLISPLYGNLQGLPPIFIQVGTAEILLDDSIRFAKKAEKAGVKIELDAWEDMPHVFAAFASMTPEGKEGIEKIGEFIKKFF